MERPIAYIINESVAEAVECKLVKEDNDFVIAEGVLQQAGKINRNKRFYTEEDLHKEIYGPRVRELVSTGNFKGEAGHPTDMSLARQQKVDPTLEQVWYTKLWIENGFVKGPDSSIPFIAYPTRSVTEAIANGVGHRNYFLVGTQIEVNLFDDRLEVISPGSLFTSSEHHRNEKNLASLIPGRRNNLICSLLSFCGYMDMHGTGLDKIIEEYKPYGDSYAPFANSDTNYFSLTLLNLTYDRKKLNGSLPLIRIDGDLTEREQKILSYCYYEPKSISEIADFLKIKPSTYLRRSIIGSLVMGGYLLPLNSDGKALFRTSHEKAILL